MQRHDQRGSNPVDRFQNHVARMAAKQPEFVLEPDNVSTARLYCGGGCDEAGGIAFNDHAAYRRGKGYVIGGRSHGVDIDCGIRKTCRD